MSDELAAQAVEITDAWGRAHYALLHLLVTRKRPPQSMLEPVRVEHPARRVREEKQAVETDPAVIFAFFSRR